MNEIDKPKFNPKAWVVTVRLLCKSEEESDTMPTADDFRVELAGILQRAEQQGRPHAEINAGELHRLVGGYPTKEGNQHSMPTCCSVLRAELDMGKAEVIYAPAKGNGASLTIRYDLPRPRSGG